MNRQLDYHRILAGRWNFRQVVNSGLTVVYDQRLWLQFFDDSCHAAGVRDLCCSMLCMSVHVDLNSSLCCLQWRAMECIRLGVITFSRLPLQTSFVR